MSARSYRIFSPEYISIAEIEPNGGGPKTPHTHSMTIFSSLMKDMPFSADLGKFNSDYLRLTRQVTE